ncbi:MAG: hypothetical protein L6455_01985 [Kiritimatiellae bacterium]|nr:hypothetical protein [Kiritimatiellia bacterium]
MIKHIAFPDDGENTYYNSTEGLKRPVKIDSTGYIGNFYDDYQGVEHILWEYDENGEPKVRYTLGPRVDEIISKTTASGETIYYHYDGLGSVVALTDENGNVIGRYEYAPFGKILSQPDGIDNKFTFQGREYDRDSGLYYYRTRYLDPEIGRFISRDPIGDIANPVSRRVRTEVMTALYQTAMLQLILADNETLSTADRMGLVAGAIADLKLAGVVASGDPTFALYFGGLNQYVFCANNPVNFRDPTGLIWGGAGLIALNVGVWSQVSVDIQHIFLDRGAIAAEIQANADTMNMLRQVIASNGEMEWPDNYGQAGQMGTDLPPQGDVCEKRQKVRNLFESRRNILGYPSAGGELAARLATGAIQPLPKDMLPGYRLELAKALLQRQQAYQDFLNWGAK